MLIISRGFCDPEDLQFRVHLTIKYHNSRKPETVFNFEGTCFPRHHTQGSQVFLFLRKDSIENFGYSSDDAYILYLDFEPKLEMVFRYKLLVESLVGEFFFVCYDGVFHEFRKYGSHRTSQANSAGLVAHQHSHRDNEIESYCSCPTFFDALVERREPKFDNYRCASFFCYTTKFRFLVMIDLALGLSTFGNWVDGVTTTTDKFPPFHPVSGCPRADADANFNPLALRTLPITVWRRRGAHPSLELYRPAYPYSPRALAESLKNSFTASGSLEQL